MKRKYALPSISICFGFCSPCRRSEPQSLIRNEPARLIPLISEPLSPWGAAVISKQRLLHESSYPFISGFRKGEVHIFRFIEPSRQLGSRRLRLTDVLP